MNRSEAVADTSVLYYLHQIDLLSLLPRLFKTVYVPDAVWAELDRGRKLGWTAPGHAEVPFAVPVAIPDFPTFKDQDLGGGEKAVITAAHYSGAVALLDDLAARREAKSLKVDAVGTVGILLDAKRLRLLSAVAPSLHTLVAIGFRLERKLLEGALRRAGEW